MFAGGDVAPSDAFGRPSPSGTARVAARHIDAWLRNRAVSAAGPGDGPAPVPFERLNTWYFSDAPHAVRPRAGGCPPDAATSARSSAVWTSETALYEARRCLSCGNCFGCDNCYGVCPDNAVHKIDGAHGYAIDYDYCKGCGLCVAECPSGAIVMVAEQS